MNVKLQSHQNISSRNHQVMRIYHTQVSLIIHIGDYLDCGNCVSHVFDANTEIWYHCDDSNITEISDFPEGVYTRESRKLTTTKRETYVRFYRHFFVVYI